MSHWWLVVLLAMLAVGAAVALSLIFDHFWPYDN